MFEYLLKTFGSKPKSSELALFLDGNIYRQNTIEAAQYNALVVGFNGIMSPVCEFCLTCPCGHCDWSDSALEQLAKLFNGETRVANDTPHGEGIDRVMTRNC